MAGVHDSGNEINTCDYYLMKYGRCIVLKHICKQMDLYELYSVKLNNILPSSQYEIQKIHT